MSGVFWAHPHRTTTTCRGRRDLDLTGEVADVRDRGQFWDSESAHGDREALEEAESLAVVLSLSLDPESPSEELDHSFVERLEGGPSEVGMMSASDMHHFRHPTGREDGEFRDYSDIGCGVSSPFPGLSRE